MSETNTGGGAAVGGNANTGGGGFVGRDEHNASVNVSIENNDHLWAIRSQLSRLEDNVNFRLTLIERDIEEAKDDIRSNQQAVPGLNWASIITAIATLCLVLALIYFGNGLYAVAAELKLDRIQPIERGR